MAQSIALSDIQDGGAQMRVEMKPDVVLDYAEDMATGATFPPVVVYHDGTYYWLADGFHRVEAARKIGCETIETEVIEGTAPDAEEEQEVDPEDLFQEASRQQTSVVQYRDVRAPSRYSEGSALNAERIPWRYRSLVKKYFLAIRPDERK